MEINDTIFKNILNDTVKNVIQNLNASYSGVLNVTNGENVTEPFDLIEEFKEHEKELIVYKYVAYIVGVLIILSNLVVVVSSGLILKKGQQPKSTYLLLGNVSLADTIIGFSIIVGSSYENNSDSLMCIFQIGMLVCPAIVSIFSVGLIAVDRYIYILHGLYYQRWFNTTKVRVAIVCIWIAGIALGFTPVTGWRNHELDFVNKCTYVSLFPKSIVIFNASLSTLPIILVGVLYSIILLKALKNLNKIQASKNNSSLNDKDHLRAFRGKNNTNDNTKVDKFESNDSVEFPNKTDDSMKRSASLDGNLDGLPKHSKHLKSISVDNLVNNAEVIDDIPHDCVAIQTKYGKTGIPDNSSSDFSIYTIQSSSEHNASTSSVAGSQEPKENKCKYCLKKLNPIKPKEPKKLRAITVVMLTSGSFICTWLPFFIMVIFYVLCEDKRYNPKCFKLLATYGPPITTLAFFNSILNPLIYAWWHKGFKRSIRSYFHKYCRKRCNKLAVVAAKNIQ